MTSAASLREIDAALEQLSDAFRYDPPSRWQSAYDALREIRYRLRGMRVRMAWLGSAAFISGVAAAILLPQLRPAPANLVTLSLILGFGARTVVEAMAELLARWRFPEWRRAAEIEQACSYFEGSGVIIGASRAPPYEVMAALRELETSTAPAELGRAYATVQQRQKAQAPLSLSWRGLRQIGLLLIPLTVFPLFVTNDRWSDVPEFWRGIFIALMVVWAIDRIPHIFAEPPLFAKRLETALARWRHLVPAMRELPPNE
jgi:hypothetical protein